MVFEDIGILSCVIVVPGIVLSIRSCAESEKDQEIVCHPEHEAPFFFAKSILEKHPKNLIF